MYKSKQVITVPLGNSKGIITLEVVSPSEPNEKEAQSKLRSLKAAINSQQANESQIKINEV